MSEPQETKNSYKIVLPIYLAIAMTIGFLLAYFLFSKKDKKPTEQSVLNPKLTEVQTLIDNFYFDDINSDAVTDDMIRSLLSDLDPHSNYMNKEEAKSFAETMSGGFEGIGIQFNVLSDTLVVVSVIGGGPSEKVGILPGDKFINVDKQCIAGVGIQNNEIVNTLRGKKGTKVSIDVLRSGNRDLISFSLKREPIEVNSINFSYMIRPTIGYIIIDNFGLKTGKEFVSHLKQLQKEGAKDLIIDLRSNGGGYLGAVIEICEELFPKNKLIVYTQGKNSPKEEYRTYFTGRFSKPENRLVVLIDDYSASASEILAGAVQDHDRGTIIGRRSFGKGLVQREFKLKDGSEVLLTISKYFTPLGRSIQRPFVPGEKENYFSEMNDRYQNGELEDQSKAKHNDSLTFTTAAGKTVYGGGGIFPDIFVPIEFDDSVVYFNQINNYGLVYQYAIKYVNNNRKSLKTKYPTAKDFIEQFSINQSIINEIEEEARKKSIIGHLSTSSKNELCKWTKAYIGRNLYGDQAFYPVIHQDDAMIQEALKVFQQ